MNIAYVTAGAAGMYCGSCLHDNTLATELIRQGHDVSLIPTYTPIRTDELDVSIDRVFYGAINVYLEQKSSFFRHTPRFIDRLLNNTSLLNWVSGKQSSVDAAQLGELTLSVLEGEEGKQAKELERLVDWLRDDLKPDIVNLTNTMFLGMARRIKQELGVPVICSVQGEDIFYDDLIEPYKGRILSVLKERAQDADGYLSTSRYYVEPMSELLGVAPEKIDVVPLGIRLADHAEPPPRDEGRPFTIGYLARICPEKGLHLLLDAFRQLLDESDDRSQLKLRIGGYLGERDRAYDAELKAHAKEWGIDDRIDWLGEVDRAQKLDLLHSIDVLSVPTIYREPKGLPVIEALANAVPVVQPAHGAFVEMHEELGGGLLFEPGNVTALVQALDRLRQDPTTRVRLGREGMEAVHRLRDDETMARRTIEVYETFLNRGEHG